MAALDRNGVFRYVPHVREEHTSPVASASSGKLPAKLRQSRKASGLRQIELARLLGVTPRYVRYWESGGRPPGDGRVAEWARLTGFPLSWFYRDEEAA